MVKMIQNWAGKKQPTNPEHKEQHTKRKTKEEIIHRWQEDDWKRQYKDYIEHADQSL